MATNYEIGLAEGRAEGAAAVAVLCKRIDELKSERDEWKQQHENLVEVRRRDLEAMQAKIDRLSQGKTGATK